MSGTGVSKLNQQNILSLKCCLITNVLRSRLRVAYIKLNTLKKQ